MKSTYNPKLLVPFRTNGTPMTWVESKPGEPWDDELLAKGHHVWKPNDAFDASMEFQCFQRGRSSATAVLKDMATGVQYEMFLSDFQDVMTSNAISACVIAGTFAFVKKGANFGVKLVSAPEAGRAALFADVPEDTKLFMAMIGDETPEPEDAGPEDGFTAAVGHRVASQEVALLWATDRAEAFNYAVAQYSNGGDRAVTVIEVPLELLSGDGTP